jgi:hypothetical protein
MSWFVIGAEILSFAWVWSRWLTGEKAWKNDLFDYSVGVIAVASWIVNAMAVDSNPYLTGEISVLYSSLDLSLALLYVIAHIAVWAGITWIFMRFRVKVARS